MKKPAIPTFIAACPAPKKSPLAGIITSVITLLIAYFVFEYVVKPYFDKQQNPTNETQTS